MDPQTTPAPQSEPAPRVTVSLPATLTSPQPAGDISCAAATVGEALRTVVGREPQYGPRIFYRDRLLVVVSLNGRLVPPGEALGTALSDGDRVEVTLPVAGG